MFSGIILTWFVLTALSVVFVAIDIRSTPESPVLKWGFVIVTLFTGPIGAMLYVLGCREPLAGTHEQYVVAQMAASARLHDALRSWRRHRNSGRRGYRWIPDATAGA